MPLSSGVDVEQDHKGAVVTVTGTIHTHFSAHLVDGFNNGIKFHIELDPLLFSLDSLFYVPCLHLVGLLQSTALCELRICPVDEGTIEPSSPSSSPNLRSLCFAMKEI